MSDEAKRSSQARRKLFENQGFSREVAERLNLDRKMVKVPINALVVAGAVPCSRPDNAEALAMDGAWLLLSIGSRVRADAIARVTPRFASMTLQIDGDRPHGTSSVATTFEDEVASIFKASWTVAATGVMPPV